MEPAHGWAELATGPRLPYVEQGDAAGVPVVLLHAYVESWRYFELLLPHLTRSLHVFAPTQRGQGEAQGRASGLGLDELAGDVVAFMDAVGLERAILVGQSSGGYVAQRVAADHPERTLALVLSGSPRSLRDKPGVSAFLESLAEQPDPPDPAFVREFVAGTLGRPLPADVLDVLVAESRRASLRVWREALRALVDAEPPTDAATITVPTLVLWGDRDGFLARADQDALVAVIPGATLRVYEGSGHSLALENPERLAADVADFATRVAVAGR